MSWDREGNRDLPLGLGVWFRGSSRGEIDPMQPMVHGSVGPEPCSRGQQPLWTMETGAKQVSRAALGRVTTAEHSLVITRDKGGSAGPWPGPGVQQGSSSCSSGQSKSEVQLESSSHRKALPGVLCLRPPKEKGCLYLGSEPQ